MPGDTFAYAIAYRNAGAANALDERAHRVECQWLIALVGTPFVFGDPQWQGQVSTNLIFGIFNFGFVRSFDLRDQIGVLPDRHAILAPVQAKRPARQALARIPFALPMMQQRARRKPLEIERHDHRAGGHRAGASLHNDPDYAGAGFRTVAPRMWRQAGVTAADVDSSLKGLFGKGKPIAGAEVRAGRLAGPRVVQRGQDRLFQTYRREVDFIQRYVFPGGMLPTPRADVLILKVRAVLQTLRESYGTEIWKRYGFVDAFNPMTGWVSSDVVGIDVGISMIMAENARTQFVWNTFMRNREVKLAMDQAGFHSPGPYNPEYALAAKPAL